MQCVRCHTIKLPGEFYANDRTCKPCRRALVKANRQSKAEYYRQYEQVRSKTEKRRALNRRVAKEWRDNHPKERSAQVAVGNAVRDGRLIPWPVCAVPTCEEKPVAHHPDYDQPLQVVWLCQAHHKQTHALTSGEE